ncbi:plastid/chloroplast ribosomal protein L4 [Haematococcus lacustris]
MLMNRIAKVAPFTCAAQRAPVCARAVGRQSLRIRSSAVAEPALLPYKAIDGSDKGTQSLALRVADPSTAKAVVHRYMVMVRRNARRGTASTLTRSEVRGGGKKPYAQKGTGNARRGSSVSPLFPGGGITFGPKPKDWKIKMNKKERRLAMATTLQSSAEDITVVESLAGKVSDKKTRTLLALLKQMTGFDAMKQKVLLILKERDEGVILAGRNVEKLYINTTDEIRVLDVMKAHKIVIEDGALEQIKSMFGGAAAQPEEAVAA